MVSSIPKNQLRDDGLEQRTTATFLKLFAYLPHMVITLRRLSLVWAFQCKMSGRPRDY
jgi:hypothetical protein